LVKLLTQQSAAPSTTREEIEEDPFVLALRLDYGLVEGTLEPILSRGEGGDEKNERQEGERFFHGYLTDLKYRDVSLECQQKVESSPGRPPYL